MAAIDTNQPRKVEVKTADGVVGTTGKNTIIYAITVKGGSDGTTRAEMHDGESTSGTAQEDAIALQNETVSIYYGECGVWYDGGAYLNITAATASTVTIVYNQEE